VKVVRVKRINKMVHDGIRNNKDEVSPKDGLVSLKFDIVLEEEMSEKIKAEE
jgi:hypothetical protein